MQCLYLLQKFLLYFQEKSLMKVWWNKVISEPCPYWIICPRFSAEGRWKMASTLYSQHVASVHSQGPQLCARSHHDDNCFWQLGPLCLRRGLTRSPFLLCRLSSHQHVAFWLSPHEVLFQYQPLHQPACCCLTVPSHMLTTTIPCQQWRKGAGQKSQQLSSVLG